MTVMYPEATKAQGNTSVTVAQTVTTSGPLLATEIDAATSVDVSCFLYAGGAGTSSQSKGTAPDRLCSTDSFEQFGRTTYTVSDLSYVYDPQGAPEDPANAARTALTEGSDVWLVVRRGKSAQDDPYAVGDLVDLWHVRLGRQNKTTTGGDTPDEFAEYSILQSVIVLEPPVEDVALAA